MGLLSVSLMVVSICILSTIVKFHLAVANSLQSYNPTCSGVEHSALLQFKQSFLINRSASSFFDGAYPKTLSWKSDRSCCSWDGVECDEETGHVIGLDLSGSCLDGSINSSSSLFRLVHLESLNLAYNYFNFSQIPPTIRNFPRLRYLNFSHSDFSGQVPSEISQLSKLSSLDMSNNFVLFPNKGFLRSFVQNLTGLEKLHLSSINISSAVPDTLTNSSLLTSLVLSSCSLFGEFQRIIFKLQSLKVLDLSDNPALTGYFPDDYNGSSPNLISLKLSDTNFYIDLPSLMARFHSLKELDVSSCNISEGPVPFSLGHLRDLVYLDLAYNRFNGQIPAAALRNLTQLTYLSLSSNNFDGQIPAAALRNLTQLTSLLLYSNNFDGSIPESLFNLRDLVYLDLAYNRFNGQIPAAALRNLTQLTSLSLFSNNFDGSIPESLFSLMNLHTLLLDHNNLSGTVELQKFLNLRNLTILDLSNNNLELLVESRFFNNATTVLPSFEYLGLGGCAIREFPYFLRFQDSLSFLDLSGNKLQGQVPKWFLNISTHTLGYMNLSHNFLSGFDQPPAVLPWVNMEVLDLSFNILRGSLWIPMPSITYFTVSNNNLTGQVSPIICSMTSLSYLDVSNNKLSGILPQCRGNFGYNLKYLNLGNNSFHGNLPEAFTNGSYLSMLDISRNNFHGQLPWSLLNCASLVSLVLSHNKFTDTFPVWLGDLPELKLLMMDHNGFYGMIAKPKMKDLHFPVLCILDLSCNNFTGQFPFEYIFSGNGTTSITHDLEYFTNSYPSMYSLFASVYLSITIISKGVERNYPKIREDLILIDISSNNFEGKIPEFIGKLSEIWSLNISNNILTGSIPSSLSNLTRLESLDLSQNKLSGEIPQQLAKLGFLAKFNVSHNNLKGPIPSGNQFTTFDSTSYMGNPGLCGDLLPKKCGDSNGTTEQLPPSTSEEANSSDSGIRLDWKFALAGLGSGLLVGVVLADFVITKWNFWFFEIVAVLIRLTRRMRRPRN